MQQLKEEELKQMLDDETWITPQEAIEKGFITAIINEKEAEEVSQSVKKSLMKLILNAKKDDENKKKCEVDNDEGEDDEDEADNEDEKPNELNISSFLKLFK